MRGQHLRLSIATKTERRIGELLKKNKVKFKVKQRVGRYEVDFIVGRLIIEIDGKVHLRINPLKDTFLFSQGYVPVHLSAYAKDLEDVEKEILYLIKANNKHG